MPSALVDEDYFRSGGSSSGGSSGGNNDGGHIAPEMQLGMDASEYAGTVQAIVSDVNGGAPEAAALEEAFKESTGEYSTTYHPNMSTITGSW